MKFVNYVFGFALGYTLLFGQGYNKSTGVAVLIALWATSAAAVSTLKD